MFKSARRRLGRLVQLIRDPQALGDRPNDRLVVGYLPWWPSNPYQVLLQQKLTARRIDVRPVRLDLKRLLRLLLRRDPIDVLHIHWPHGMYVDRYWRFPLALFSLCLYRLFKNNVIWTVHELEFYETRYPILDRVMVRFLMRICRLLIVHSAYSEKIVRTRYRFQRDVKQVLHPSYVERYENHIGRRAARRELGLNNAETVYLFMGHVKAYKGVEDLIAAFKKIPEESVRLYIVGQPMDGETEKRIREISAVDSRILLELSYVPDHRVQIYMNAADVVVFPFRKTHTSGSVLLAMSFAKAVIAPALASIPEYVGEAAGVLFDPSHSSGLYAALHEALKRDLAAMGRVAYERVAGRNWEDFASFHASVYAALNPTGDKRSAIK
jgi:beta-1,4-mannosyltransferase